MNMRPLEIGLSRALHVREERLASGQDTCRLLYVSDIHLRPGRSHRLCRQVLDAATRTDPDVVLLGGDMVDRRTELDALSALCRALRRIAPVLAIGGNHDAQIGIDDVRVSVEAGGGHWIHENRARLNYGCRVILVSGPDAAPLQNTDAADVRILCAHNPRIWKRSCDAGYHLVLAGHLHGCQVVAYQYRHRLFPGALFYPYCFLTHHFGSTRLVVSRGVSDLVPIRWRCPREVVLCHV